MKIALDIKSWRKLPQCERTWGVPDDAPTVVKFVLTGRSDIISANVSEGWLEIFPARSSQHAALRSVLVG